MANHHIDEIAPILVLNHPFRDEIVRCYRQNLRRIRSRARQYNNGNSIFNFQLFGERLLPREELDRNVLDHQNHAFRLNASFGYILFNTRTHVCRYHYACWQNASVFEDTPFVNSRADWNRITEKLCSTDIMTAVMFERESTEWTIVWVNNLQIWLWANHAQVINM